MGRGASDDVAEVSGRVSGRSSRKDIEGFSIFVPDEDSPFDEEYQRSLMERIARAQLGRRDVTITLVACLRCGHKVEEHAPRCEACGCERYGPSSSATDMQGNITIQSDNPKDGDALDRAIAMEGFLRHELAHEEYTDPETTVKFFEELGRLAASGEGLKAAQLQRIANALEDGMIESRLMAHRPGVYTSIELMNEVAPRIPDSFTVEEDIIIPMPDDVIKDVNGKKLKDTIKEINPSTGKEEKMLRIPAGTELPVWTDSPFNPMMQMDAALIAESVPGFSPGELHPTVQDALDECRPHIDAAVRGNTADSVARAFEIHDILQKHGILPPDQAAQDLQDQIEENVSGPEDPNRPENAESRCQSGGQSLAPSNGMGGSSGMSDQLREDLENGISQDDKDNMQGGADGGSGSDGEGGEGQESGAGGTNAPGGMQGNPQQSNLNNIDEEKRKEREEAAKNLGIDPPEQTEPSRTDQGSGSPDGEAGEGGAEGSGGSSPEGGEAGGSGSVSGGGSPEGGEAGGSGSGGGSPGGQESAASGSGSGGGSPGGQESAASGSGSEGGSPGGQESSDSASGSGSGGGSPGGQESSDSASGSGSTSTEKVNAEDGSEMGNPTPAGPDGGQIRGPGGSASSQLGENSSSQNASNQSGSSAGEANQDSSGNNQGDSAGEGASSQMGESGERSGSQSASSGSGAEGEQDFSEENGKSSTGGGEEVGQNSNTSEGQNQLGDIEGSSAGDSNNNQMTSEQQVASENDSGDGSGQTALAGEDAQPLDGPPKNPERRKKESKSSVMSKIKNAVGVGDKSNSEKTDQDSADYDADLDDGSAPGGFGGKAYDPTVPLPQGFREEAEARSKARREKRKSDLSQRKQEIAAQEKTRKEIDARERHNRINRGDVGVKDFSMPRHFSDPISQEEMEGRSEAHRLNDIDSEGERELRKQGRMVGRRIKKIKASVEKPKNRQKSGRFDTSSSSIMRAAKGDRRVFIRENKAKDMDLYIDVCVDRSYSINSGMAQKQYEAAKIITYAAEAAGIPLGVFGYSGHDEEWGAQIIEYKRPQSNSSKGLGSIREHGDGGTPTAQGVQFGRARARRAKEKNKYLIVVTDGEANDIPRAREQVEQAQRDGVKVIGIGVGGVDPRSMAATFGDENWSILDDFRDIGNIVVSLIEEAAEGIKDRK